MGIRVGMCLVLLLLAGCAQDERQAPESGPSQSAKSFELSLTDEQFDWVGEQIFRNECAARVQCLVHWNEGEAFPSLGIGHFIWYPEGVNGRFTESFPALIDFMTKRGARPPQWLLDLEPMDAPWPDRDAFLGVEDSEQVVSLRAFLSETRGMQVQFIFQRAGASLSRVVDAAPPAEQDAIAGRIQRLSETPGGVYALMDYVNFKGEGLAKTEAYQGEGWGLLQVLRQMPGEEADTTLGQFRRAAATVLTRRAGNAENAIERERWLPGWLKRLETYRERG